MIFALFIDYQIQRTIFNYPPNLWPIIKNYPFIIIPHFFPYFTYFFSYLHSIFTTKTSHFIQPIQVSTSISRKIHRPHLTVRRPRPNLIPPIYHPFPIYIAKLYIQPHPIIYYRHILPLIFYCIFQKTGICMYPRFFPLNLATLGLQ